MPQASNYIGSHTQYRPADSPSVLFEVVTSGISIAGGGDLACH